MSIRQGWHFNGYHFTRTTTERGGERHFIDGKPTDRSNWLRQLSVARAGDKVIEEAHARIANETPCPKCGMKWGLLSRCAQPDCPSPEARLIRFRKELTA